MKILVLGSEGQIGQYFQSCEGLEILRSDVALSANMDLRIPGNPTVAAQLGQADMVIFLAFDVGGSAYLEKVQGSVDYLDHNLMLLKNTFRLLKNTNKPFIYVSSQMSNMIDSTYGMLKRIGEFYAKALGGITVRLWNVYGEEHDTEKFHVITDFINMARDGVIQMRTYGYEQRQFLWAEDCVDAFYALVANYADLDPQKYYDITSFQWTSIIDLARMIADLTPGTVAIRPGDKLDETQKIFNTPTEEILDYWQPTTSLSDGIKMLMA